jgi:hypothetical protein
VEVEMRGRTVAAVLAAAATMAGTMAAPASAAPLERGTFEFTDSFTFDDCGFEVAVDETISGRYVIKDSTPKTDGQYFQVQQQTEYYGVYTNVATGEFGTQEWRTTFKEMPATIISDDGPVVTYRTHESGVWDVLRDSSGAVVYRSVGNLVMEYEFDTLGDSAPGGTFLSEQFVRASGIWQTLDADYCELLTDIIG